ncbi:MAG: SpoIIE family protein phosphatase [Salibacteraceae bacterium]
MDKQKEVKKTNILVVEDEGGMALLVTRVLEKLGYSVLKVETTGQGAIDSARINKPDLILMDIYLEGEMTGIQAAEAILNATNIPVIYATSDGDEQTIKNARSTYPLGYILKPYNKNILKSTIEVALSIKEVENRKNQELQNAYDTISNQTNELLESFKAAKDIQSAILPSEDSFTQEKDNSFILNLPKESLGGDFFWYKNLNNSNKLFAVIDCTGHGVPGALMSILVNYQLSKTLGQLKEGDELGTIFNHVDQVLSNTFQGNVVGIDSNDINDLNAGFDASMCLYNPRTRVLNYCGAKRPLIIIRNGLMIELKGNRSSVGLYILNEKKFESEEIQLESGDHVYLFSDGYTDQMGGEFEKRFKIRPFKKLLQEISKEKPEVQKQILEEKFINWKGNSEQMDDVLVLGFKVT